MQISPRSGTLAGAVRHTQRLGLHQTKQFSKPCLQSRRIRTPVVVLHSSRRASLSPSKHHQHARRVDCRHGGRYQPPLDHPRGPQRHLGVHQPLRLDLSAGEFSPPRDPRGGRLWCVCLSNRSAQVTQINRHMPLLSRARRRNLQLPMSSSCDLGHTRFELIWGRKGDGSHSSS